MDRLLRLPNGAKLKVDTPTPGSLFITPAGASYDTSASVVVFAVRDNARRIGGAIYSGDHFLQVVVPTWPASDKLLERLRERWRPIGDLWSQTVTSQPMAFKIEEHRSLENCSPFAEILASGQNNPNSKDESGFTALMAAVFDRNEQVFSELLKRGADVNAKNSHGITALTIAAVQSDGEFLKALLEHGADVNARTDDGDTALLLLLGGCDPEEAKTLIDAGADVNAKDRKGRTALMLAEECDGEGRAELVRLLKQAGAGRN